MKVTATKSKTYEIDDSLTKARIREEAKYRFERDEKRIKIKVEQNDKS
jgi:hypothetical protein